MCLPASTKGVRHALACRYFARNPFSRGSDKLKHVGPEDKTEDREEMNPRQGHFRGLE